LSTSGTWPATIFAGQALGDRGLAHTRITDEQRIVLLPAAKHLHGAHDFLFAADQRIDLAVARLLVEVHAVRVERIAWLSLLALSRADVLVDAAHVARLEHARTFRNTMGDVLNSVKARHFLLLQKIGGMAFAFREDADEHVGARHFFATRGLHVHDGPLHDALE
jgi:hypothetical protein